MSENLRAALLFHDRLGGDALASWLDTLPGYLVVGVTTTPSDLLRLCQLRPPDVVVMQVGSIGVDELGLIHRLAHTRPRPHVIGLHHVVEPVMSPRLCEVGMGQLVSVRHGLAPLRAALCRARAACSGAAARGGLTDREMTVLELICAGGSVERLAETLELSPHTVVNYKRRIFVKLGVQSRAQAAAVATRLGLVRAEPRRRPYEVLPREDAPITLTHREHDILRSIARGESVRQTAQSLGISAKTVQAEQRQLFYKLGVHNRAAALHVARELGLLDES